MAHRQIDPHQFKLDPVPGQQYRLDDITQPQLGLMDTCLLGVKAMMVDWVMVHL
jgi:hypothetical protein